MERVCVVIPDNTRDFHPKLVLPVISRGLKRISKDVTFIVALGLHKKLSKKELAALLGKGFLRKNKVIQHDAGDVKFLGRAKGAPIYINGNILSCNLIFTVGVVEPHLYSGFSGGVKCIGIGLAGKKTILATHSVRFLNKKGVGLANIEGNPFYAFLWDAVKKINVPVYSLNIVNDKKKHKIFLFPGKARPSFIDAVRYAQKIFRYKIRRKFDAAFITCDPPKDKSLYQVTRLFNYALDKKPVVKKGGAIFVSAGLGSKRKSRAESNFERALRDARLPKGYKFTKPGEHRAFKVIEASRYARLGIITPNPPKLRTPYITFFKDHKEALAMARQAYGSRMRKIIIPSGFSFIPC